MLYWLADELNDGFFLYVDKLAPICVESLRFPYDDHVRTASASLIPCLLRATKAYMEIHNQSTSPIHQLFQYFISHLLAAIREELDLEVLIAFLSSLQSVLIFNNSI